MAEVPEALPPNAPNVEDGVDRLLQQWSWAPYDMPLVPMAIAKRITSLARRLDDLADQALAPHGLERAEFDVLVTVLRSGPAGETTPTRLTWDLDISSGGLTKRLIRLEQRGLITRRIDPADRRSLLVALTPAGRTLTEAAVGTHTRAVAGLVAALPEADRRRLADLLRTIVLSDDQPPTAATRTRGPDDDPS